MLTREDVRIQSPCGVDFRKMTRVEATKRFCAECRKHVHDLTAMTEDEAKALLDSPATDGLCVRYLADERGRIVFLPVPVQNLTVRKRAVLAASMVAAATSLTACMGAMQPPPRPIVAQPEAPRRFEIVRGQTRLAIVDQPGALIDESAPPPPPGTQLAPHPFLSGSCGGDPLGCSEARALLEGSRSTDEFVAKLTNAGFTVGPGR